MTKHLVLSAMLAVAPFATQAGELSYNYVEGGYAKVHVDDRFANNPEMDGAYVRGSAAIGSSFHVFGGTGRVSGDINASVFGTELDLDLTQSEIGVGYHQAMGESVDFIAELAYLRQDFDVKAAGFGSSEADAKGGRISVGLRGAMSERLEGWVKVGYLDGGDFTDAFAGTLGGQIKFNQTWGVVAEVEIIEDTTRYLAGVRASF